MASVGKVDQLVLQLRAQLQRAASHRARQGKAVKAVGKGPLERLKSLEGSGSYEGRELRRKFIRALLMEELGEELANQPEFERVSNEVWSLIEGDDGLKRQLDEALAELGR